MDINLSYIIVTYNSADYIFNCLHSIFSQESENIRSEIIVVDNASEDETVNVIKEKFPQVICIENKENVGFAVAVNQAASMSKGEYLILLNPDTVLKNNFINELFSFVNNTPDASIVGVKIVDGNNNHQPSAWKKVSFFTLLAEMLLPYNVSIKLVTERPNTPTPVENVSGACMLIQRDAFQRLGGFDERFFLYYEEIDFCIRAKQRGHKIYYNPDVEVVHYGAKSSTNDPERFFFNLYNSKLIYIKKHFSYLLYASGFLLVICGILLRSVASFVAGCITFRKHLLSLSKSFIFVLIKTLKNKNS